MPQKMMRDNLVLKCYFLKLFVSFNTVYFVIDIITEIEIKNFSSVIGNYFFFLIGCTLNLSPATSSIVEGTGYSPAKDFGEYLAITILALFSRRFVFKWCGSDE